MGNGGKTMEIQCLDEINSAWRTVATPLGNYKDGKQWIAANGETGRMYQVVFVYPIVRRLKDRTLRALADEIKG